MGRRVGGVAPKCNAAALALSSPSTPGLWCQSTTERLWHHKPGVLGLESASAAALHLVPLPPHVYPSSTSRDVSDQAYHAHNCPHAHNSPAYNERLVGKAWERGYTVPAMLALTILS